jgi:hypothetical protein
MHSKSMFFQNIGQLAQRAKRGSNSRPAFNAERAARETGIRFAAGVQR